MLSKQPSASHFAGKIVRKSSSGALLPKNEPATLEDKLLKKSQEVERRKTVMREKALEAELAKCTFKPQINARPSSSKDNSFVRPLHRPTEQVKLEKALEECTFHPKINSSQRQVLAENDPNHPDQIQGYHSSVSRMRNAEAERKVKQDFLKK